MMVLLYLFLYISGEREPCTCSGECVEVRHLGVLSLLPCGSRDQTQAMGLGDKCFYLLHHLLWDLQKEVPAPAFSRNPGTRGQVEPRAAWAETSLACSLSELAGTPGLSQSHTVTRHRHPWHYWEEVDLVEGRRGHRERRALQGSGGSGPPSSLSLCSLPLTGIWCGFPAVLKNLGPKPVNFCRRCQQDCLWAQGLAEKGGENPFQEGALQFLHVVS